MFRTCSPSNNGTPSIHHVETANWLFSSKAGAWLKNTTHWNCILRVAEKWHVRQKQLDVIIRFLKDCKRNNWNWKTCVHQKFGNLSVNDHLAEDSMFSILSYSENFLLNLFDCFHRRVNSANNPEMYFPVAFPTRFVLYRACSTVSKMLRWSTTVTYLRVSFPLFCFPIQLIRYAARERCETQERLVRGLPAPLA